MARYPAVSNVEILESSIKLTVPSQSIPGLWTTINYLVNDDISEDPGFSYDRGSFETSHFISQGNWRLNGLFYYPSEPSLSENELMCVFLKQELVDVFKTAFPGGKLVAFSIESELYYFGGDYDQLKGFMFLPTDNGCTSSWECAYSMQGNVAVLADLDQSKKWNRHNHLFVIPDGPYSDSAKNIDSWSALSSPPIFGVRYNEGLIHSMTFYFEPENPVFWEGFKNCIELTIEE